MRVWLCIKTSGRGSSQPVAAISIALDEKCHCARLAPMTSRPRFLRLQIIYAVNLRSQPAHGEEGGGGLIRRDGGSHSVVDFRFFDNSAVNESCPRLLPQPNHDSPPVMLQTAARSTGVRRWYDPFGGCFRDATAAACLDFHHFGCLLGFPTS